MINILQQAGKTVYNNKQYCVDTIDDLKDLPIEGIAPGSLAFVISESRGFMLTSTGEWKEI
jgi:hypothetical protein